MQACAVTVLEVGDDAGEKIGQLAAQLQEQGYTVQTVSVSVSDPVSSDVASVTPITAAAGGPGGAEPAAPMTEPPDETKNDGSVISQVGPDNELPQKCAACGQTYPIATMCENQHEATATLPTSDVLAGATVEDAAQATAAETAETAAATTAGDAAAEAPQAEQPSAEPPAPSWPQ